MSDNKQMLPNGFGYPMVWLFNTNREVIRIKDEYDKEISLNQKVTSFSYKFNEENDDLCTIKFFIGKVFQLNHELFREDQQLCVQWGYILPRGKIVKSALRTIAVRDINTNYKSDGIEIEIECTDLVSYLKNVRLNRTSSSNNFEDWLREIASGAYIPTITIEGKTTLLREDEKKEHYKDIAGITNMHLKSEPDQVIKGKSKAIHSEIEERLNQSTKGPLYLDGRDNVISIKKRDFSQAPYRQWTYWGGVGELIEFRAKSNIMTTKDDEAEEAILNPETKQIEKSKTAIASNYDDEEYEADLKERIAVGSFFTQLKVKFEQAVSNPLVQPIIENVNFRDNKRYGGSHVGAVNIDGSTRVKYDGPRWTEDRIYTAKQLLNSPHFDLTRRQAILTNYMLKKVERKFEASAKVLGDPSIITSKIYNFNNLSNRDKGLWYATSCSHDITPQSGYIVSMELIKKPKRIANLMQKRDDVFENEENLIGSIDTKTQYTENDRNFDITVNNTESLALNESDITNRLNDQLIFEESWFTNDIPFNPKPTFNPDNISGNPNAADV